MYNGNIFYILLIRNTDFLEKYGGFLNKKDVNFGVVHNMQSALNIMNKPDFIKEERKGLLLVQCCESEAPDCPYKNSNRELEEASLDVLVVTTEGHDFKNCPYSIESGIHHVLDGPKAISFLEKHIEDNIGYINKNLNV